MSAPAPDARSYRIEICEAGTWIPEVRHLPLATAQALVTRANQGGLPQSQVACWLVLRMRACQSPLRIVSEQTGEVIP